MNRRVTLVFVAFSTLLSWKYAAAVDYKFSGVVSSAPTPYISEFSVGEILSGRLTLTLRSIQLDPTRAFYNVSNFNADIGGHYPLTSSGGTFFIGSDIADTLDAVNLHIANPPDLIAPTVSNYVPDWFEIALPYPPYYLTSLELRPQFVAPSLLGQPSYLNFSRNESHLVVRFAINDFSMVPEPAAILLTLCGTLFVPWRYAMGRSPISLARAGSPSTP